MKLLYKTLLSTMLVSPLCVNMYAQQQIPNSGFEGGWSDCVPWTFYVSEDKHGEASAVVAGKTMLFRVSRSRGQSGHP